MHPKVPLILVPAVAARNTVLVDLVGRYLDVEREKNARAMQRRA